MRDTSSPRQYERRLPEVLVEGEREMSRYDLSRLPECPDPLSIKVTAALDELQEYLARQEAEVLATAEVNARYQDRLDRWAAHLAWREQRRQVQYARLRRLARYVWQGSTFGVLAFVAGIAAGPTVWWVVEVAARAVYRMLGY